MLLYYSYVRIYDVLKKIFKTENKIIRKPTLSWQIKHLQVYNVYKDNTNVLLS